MLTCLIGNLMFFLEFWEGLAIDLANQPAEELGLMINLSQYVGLKELLTITKVI